MAAIDAIIFPAACPLIPTTISTVILIPPIQTCYSSLQQPLQPSYSSLFVLNPWCNHIYPSLPTQTYLPIPTYPTLPTHPYLPIPTYPTLPTPSLPTHPLLHIPTYPTLPTHPYLLIPTYTSLPTQPYLHHPYLLIPTYTSLPAHPYLPIHCLFYTIAIASPPYKGRMHRILQSAAYPPPPPPPNLFSPQLLIPKYILTCFRTYKTHPVTWNI
jgi:hypothetical protein